MHKCVNGYTFLLYWTFTNISLPLVTIFDLSPFCLEIATLTLFWLLFAWNFFFPSFLSQSSLFSSLQCLPSTLYWQGLELHHLAKEKGLWVQLQYHICVLCAKLLQSCPTLCHPMDCSPPGSSLLPMDLAFQVLRSMGFSRQDYQRGCHSLLQGFFLNQGSNLYLFSLLHQQVVSLPLAPSVQYHNAGRKKSEIWAKRQ